jgi:tetratricopeptide (TPR) repeat protein
MSSKRFKVAFSFAGEKRDYVSKVAAILALKFGEELILYDKYHEAEFAVYDLGIRLPKLYGQESELVVPVLCPYYDSKRWTGWEWIHIYSLLTRSEGKLVMPSRFENATADGLSPASGYMELDDKTPEQFAIRILERLAINEGKTKTYYTHSTTAIFIAPHTTIGHNLPTLQPFFGRKEELQKIASALEPDNRTWGALIDGPGGMGKTSLAVYAAYAALPDAFNRIIFISLKSRELDDDGERDLSGFIISGLRELLNELARELDRADINKLTDDQRPRQLLEALRGRRVLLVLDNLESLLKSERDILFTFVKRLPEGCKAILTSRGRIGSGAEELILEQLDEAAALAVLAELSTRNKELAKATQKEKLELYNVTGGKPLLLRWTAGQIGRGNCLNIAHALTYLRSCPSGNDPLAFIFADLARNFSEAENHALCALSYFVAPAKAEHIALIAERPEIEVTSALHSLVNRSLVIPSDELQTYTLVPLVVDFLRNHNPDVLIDTRNKLEKYVHTLAIENGYKEYSRFPVLDAAWPVIAAALPQMFTKPSDRLQEVCEAIWRFLEFTGRWDELLALSIEAGKCAIATADWINAGWRAYQAGWVYYLRMQPDKVITYSGYAEKHWQNAGDREMAFAIRLRGLGYRIGGNYAAAIEAYKQAVELWRKINPESADVSIGLNALADAERRSGDYEAAEKHYHESINIAKAINHKEGIASCTGNMADLALDREEWTKAEILARDAINLTVGKQEALALNYSRLAQALAKQRKEEEGLPYAKLAVEIYARLGSPDLVTAHNIFMECTEALN